MARVVSMDRAFNAFGYTPHRTQRQIHSAEADYRFILADCGRRFGKSHLGGRRLAVKALEAKFAKGLSRTGKRHEYWVVGPEYTDAEKEFRVLYDTIKKLGGEMDRPGTYYSPAGGSNTLSMYDGAFLVNTKSAKHPETLVGEGLHGVIFAEAAKVKPIVWPKYIRPMLSDYKGWAEFTSTPEGKNWFYDIYMLGQDPSQTEYWSIKAPSWSNNILFPGGRTDPEILSLEAGMSKEKFKQEIGAEFTEFVGRVFKDFDTETHVGDFMYDPRLPLFMAADFGYTNPNVVLFIQVDVWGKVFVIAEYYQRQRDPGELVKDIEDDPRLGALARAAVALYPDPEDPGSANMLSNKFHVKAMGNTGGPVNDRINLIRKYLRPQPIDLPWGHPDKVPHLMFDRSCTNAIREFQDYRYPETVQEQGRNTAEKPMKVDDHTPEALGRFFKGHLNQEIPSKRRSRVSEATISSG